MKIFIAHDWAIFRAGIVQILRNAFGPLEITQVSTAPEGLDLTSGPWDLAFVDVDVSDHQGLHLITALKHAHPRQRVLAVSSYPGGCRFESALKESIRGSIKSESTPDEVVAAARCAIAGGENASIASAVVSRMKALSGREAQVLRLLAAGKNVKEIAAALGVSASTISTYRVRLLRKLRLRNTGELIRYALTNHLAD